MVVRYRPMELKDVRKCVGHVAAHPVLGPRYGNLIKDLPSAIRSVLGRDSFTAEVFEEFQGSTTRFLGAGMACLSPMISSASSRPLRFSGSVPNW